jgi:putative tryptophan/tyrosine transport system substrate-binding protein
MSGRMLGALLRPACGEKVEMRELGRLAQTRGAQNPGNAPSSGSLRDPTSPRAAGRGDWRRRAFLALAGGTAAALLLRPRTVRAQQPERVRRIGILMNGAEDDPESQVEIAAFRKVLQQLGWSDGLNTRINIRWGQSDADLNRKYAAELVALAPDVILAASTLSVAALQRLTRSLPIIFVRVSDPVGAGLVNTLSRPGGNTTGFMIFEYNLSGKWLELLKQIAPNVTRVAVLRNPDNPAGIGQFGAIQTAAPALGIEVSPIGVHDATEIEGAIKTFAGVANGGLLVTPSASTSIYHDLIIALAAHHRLPAVYADRFAVAAGGLISYGPNRVEQFRLAAGYVDRVLNGEKPADLPVQAPTKFEMVINLKTAKALGLAIPQTLLATADEVIE